MKLANAVQLSEYERELSTVKGMGVYGVMNAPTTQFYAVREGIKVPYIDKYQETATDDLNFDDMIQFVLQNNMPWCPEADLREFDTLVHSGKPLIALSAELLTQ